MLDGNNNVLDEQYTTYGLTGELTLLGDTTVGGTVIVQCFDFADNADTTSVTLQAIPVSSVQAVPQGANARHLRLPVPPGHVRSARHR